MDCSAQYIITVDLYYYTLKASLFRRCLVVIFTAPYARLRKKILFAHRSGCSFCLRYHAY